VFSLNDTLGRRTPERGFVKAPVIYSGEFTEDYGGGVSQLSTTTFNAIFFGGYDDIEHTPHSVWITRYPMGREATLNYGTIDLKFLNNTSHGVLIRTSYSATTITVTFYGDNEGRKVTEADRRILTQKPLEDDLINCPARVEIDKKNDCATLPAGKTKQVEAGHTGYDVEFFRDGTRVYAGHTTQSTIEIPARWQYEGAAHSFHAGDYTWYVWPDVGGQRAARASVQTTVSIAHN
jgi:vancomycin resistance protein YoaR